MFSRVLILSAILLAGAGVILRASKPEIPPLRESVRMMPLQAGEWTGRNEADFAQGILDVLGVDDYITRTYFSPQRGYAGLYVGYYASQRQGDTMHSPLNCLPGAGWIPVKQGRITIPVQGANGPRQIEINSFIIEKGIDRQAVLYWYQAHGRIVASEYWGKIYLVTDAIRLNRTDGAMVRVTMPIQGQGDEAARVAEKRAVEFVQAIFPQLTHYLPS